MHTKDLARRTADGLGWFSLALGAAELLKPRTLGDGMGLRHPGLLRAYGLREILAGVGLLSGRGRAFWLWSRVAGDLLDLATLSRAKPRGGAEVAGLSTAVASVAGVLVIDLLAAAVLSRR